MSIEAMAHAIESDAAAEAAAIINRARAEARAIVERAEVQEAERLEEIRAGEEPAARAEAVRDVNVARLRLLERRASILAERVNAAYASAETALAALAGGADPGRWSACLERLAVEGLRLAGTAAAISARPGDVAVLRALVASDAFDAEIRVDERVAPGLVVRTSSGGLEIDATIAARLEAARMRLADAVAARVAIGTAE